MIFSFVLFFCYQSAFLIENCQSVKSGLCPPVVPGAAEICVDLCTDDETCEDYLRCCSNGCAKTCQKPINETATEPTATTESGKTMATTRTTTKLSANNQQNSTTENDHLSIKPGVCPPNRINSGLAVACFNQCLSDANCEGRKKCCYNGCGLMCETPAGETAETASTRQAAAATTTRSEPTVNLCPTGEPLTHNDTVISCEQNAGACPPTHFCLYEHSKTKFSACCPKPPCPIPRGVPGCEWVIGQPGTDGCPQYIQRCNVVPVGTNKTLGRGDKVRTELNAKPGRCPPVPPGIIGACVNECVSDSNCTDTNKCCTNGCGMTCQNALPLCQKQSLPKLPGPNCQYNIQEIGPDGCMKPVTFVCSENSRSTEIVEARNVGNHETATFAPIANSEPKRQTQQSIAKTIESVCNSMPDSGPCKNFVEKWYYDVQLGSCRLFIYGGCMGNSNQFSNLTDCERFCGQNQRERPGFCPSIVASTARTLNEMENLCAADEECPEGLKCCRTENGHSCITVGAVAKSGNCPHPNFMSAVNSACVDLCQTDFDCPGLYKCCNGGCSKVCITPLSEKACDKVHCPPCHQCVERIDGTADCIKTKNDCCPDGSIPVKCVSNPCQFAKCLKRPNARCVIDYCGSCKAVFYDPEGNRLHNC